MRLAIGQSRSRRFENTRRAGADSHRRRRGRVVKLEPPLQSSPSAETGPNLNRSFESLEKLQEYVQYLSHRIAAFPKKAVLNAKRSINVDLEDTRANEKKLYEESRLFAELMNTAEAGKAMKLFLKRGGQTREGELRVSELMVNGKSKL